MAGTTVDVKRAWGVETQGGQKDPIGALYEQFNALIDDLERVRAALGRLDGIVLEAPTLAIGTTDAAEVKNAAHDVFVRGEQVTVAAGETAFTATTHDIAADKASYYTLSVDNSGSITITKGADADPGSAVKPAGPADEVVIGWVLIATDGTSGDAFDATTDDLDAAKLTTTYEDAPLMAAGNLTAAKVTTTESGD